MEFTSADGGIEIMPLAASPSLQLTRDSHATYISSGSYVNGSFGAIMSNAEFIRLKEVNGDTYDYTPSADRLNFYRSTNGWYSLWACSKNWLGIVSKSGEYTVGLDTVKPVMTAYANGATVSNNSTVKHTITYSATDEFSGVQYYYFSINGGAYVSGGASAILSADGVYKLYCVDKAGNSSSVINVTKDSTAPTVRAYNNATGSQLGSGAITSAAAVRFEATDATTGVGGIYIQSPGTSYYTMYAGTAVTLSAEGTYYYYAKDNAANQSSTYYVTVDRTAPTAYLYSGTTSVSSGYYSAASYIRFTASDTNGCTIYMKKDSGSYATYTSGTNLTAEGVYMFYAVDPCGTSTSTYTITLDRTAPTGMLYAGTGIVSSGKITNASYVTYTATDTFALNALYVLKPGASGYVSFASGTQFTADGWYYFYAGDKSGNNSATVSILLDRTKPVLTIYGGTSTVQSGGYTNQSNVTFAASDASSGVAAMYVRLPNASGYISYVAGTPFTTEGAYYFYATDVSGNIADTVSVTLDLTKPTGAITAGGATAANDSYTNKIFYYSAADSGSGVLKCEIKRPNGIWEAYTSGTTIPVTSANGLYTFRATDRSGNLSAESRIYLMTAAPVITVYGGAVSVQSGAFTNKGYVSFTATAALSTTASLFVRIPGSGSYISYAPGTPLYGEGIYYCYATDAANNISVTVSVTLDTVKPVGAVTSDDRIVPNNGYTNNSFSYSASDALSGVAYCEVKRPDGAWETYAAGTEIPHDADCGLYIFRSFDRSGNVSEELRIYLITTMPDITIYAGTAIVSSGTFTNKYVSFAASEALSGATTLYVRLPDTDNYIPYVTGTPLNREGTYYAYAIDEANNISGEVTVTLDTTSPMGTIAANGTVVPDGGYVNKPFAYSATDNLSGVLRCEIKHPNGAWESYAAETLIPANIGGWFSFRSYDLAGNLSGESRVCVIVTLPTVTLYADEQPVINGIYTNAARIAMSASGEFVKACYVKLPSGTTFIPYTQYYSFTAAGRYEFIVEDYAGGATDIYSVIIDRAAKPVTINGVSGSKATGDVTIVWTDGDLLTTAPIVAVTVNGKSYDKGGAIKTIDGGAYRIESLDAAGNRWTATFTATRTEILSDTLNKQYYETANSAGDRFAFESYANALTFAKARETALVRAAVWSSGTWDGGIPMDSADSKNAVNGTYFIYKKSGDKNTEVAYFTLARLNAVIAEYAAESVTSYFWWQKTPAQILNGDNLYALTGDRTFIGNSVTFAAHANYLIDGEPYSGLTFGGEGEHILTVYDDFGNSYEYVLIIVKTVPDILYKLAGGAFNKASGDRIYTFKEAVTLKIADSLGGGFAMYIIRDGMGETVAIVSHGEEYTLNKSGRFTVEAINHGGLSLEISFVLSLNKPTAAFTENAANKRLELRVTPSGDGGSGLTEITIYKSVDGGLTWVLLKTDDYGRTISIDRLFYEFNRDGLYKVVAEDNFRSGIDAVTATTEYAQPAPEGALIGVTDGGYTNSAVKFTWSDEANATVTFNGVTDEYLSGAELSKDGEYVLTFTDGNGFEAIYTFTIKTTAPVVELSGEPVNGYLTESVSAAFEADCSAVLYKDGVVRQYVSGTVIQDDGAYVLTVTDRANNVTTLTFTLDTTSPNVELVGVKDGGTVKGGTVVIRNLSESATLEIYFNGSLISYTLGETLTELGSYRVALTDTAGNVTEYTFEIAYAVNTAGVIIIVAIILALIGGGVTVFLFRKRGKFKTKK
jgi:hypothetical protein